MTGIDRPFYFTIGITIAAFQDGYGQRKDQN